MMKFRTLCLVLVVSYTVGCIPWTIGMVLSVIFFASFGASWLALYAAAAVLIPLVILYLMWRRLLTMNLLRSRNHAIAAAATAAIAVPATLVIGTRKTIKSLFRSLLIEETSGERSK